MKQTSKLVPTEKYPYIKYYTTAKSPLSDSEKTELFQKYLKNTINKLKKTWQSASSEKILDMAKPVADKLLNDELNRQVYFKKVVINSYKDEIDIIPMIERNKNFIEWGI